MWVHSSGHPSVLSRKLRYIFLIFRNCFCFLLFWNRDEFGGAESVIFHAEPGPRAGEGRGGGRGEGGDGGTLDVRPSAAEPVGREDRQQEPGSEGPGAVPAERGEGRVGERKGVWKGVGGGEGQDDIEKSREGTLLTKISYQLVLIYRKLSV